MPTYILVLLVASVPLVFLPITYTNSSSLPCKPHAPPTPPSLHCSIRTTDVIEYRWIMLKNVGKGGINGWSPYAEDIPGKCFVTTSLRSLVWEFFSFVLCHLMVIYS
jgi:hypothetical protein